MNILVTGGTGYIGSHTCAALLAAGHEVIIVDNLYNSSAEVVERLEEIAGRRPLFYEADLRNRASMEKVFAENAIDAVMHFAGLKAAGESVEKPLLYYDNNLQGFLVLAEGMQKHGVTKCVFSSSATVYGAHNHVPFREEMSTAASNPYGYTKLVVEQMLADVCRVNPDWSVCALRCFNPIGAHESGLIGEEPNGVPNNLFPYIAKVATGKLSALSVFGDDYDTPDGTGVRDYIHVVDLAAGHVRALEYVQNHRGMEIVNLGTGRGTSVLELLRAFERVNGCKVPYRITARRPGDIDTCYADAQKARDLLGWEAVRSIEDMCRDGWNYVQKHRK